MKLPKGMFLRGASYYVRLFEGGRDKWVSLGADVEEAKERYHRLRAGGPEPTRHALSKAAESWLASYVQTSRNAKGVRLATSRVNLYLVQFFGDCPLSAITANDLRDYRLWLERRELAPQTVSNVLCDARCFFGWCRETGLLDRSPVPRRLMPRIQERLPDRLTDAEVGELRGIPDPFGFVVRLGLGTGLRCQRRSEKSAVRPRARPLNAEIFVP